MSATTTSRLLLVGCISLALAGCAEKPMPSMVSSRPAMPPPRAPAQSQQVAARPSSAAPVIGIVPGSARDFEVNVGDRVFFAFDKYNLDATAQASLSKQAAWLSRYPAFSIQVQGNCDERGTREYNLALGARRASAVRDYLVNAGVNASRLTTISYGKERPVCVESTEACWAQNRRAVSALMVTAPSVANAAMRQ
jgi:peptidoglycan-associated lipoprotein